MKSLKNFFPFLLITLLLVGCGNKTNQVNEANSNKGHNTNTEQSEQKDDKVNNSNTYEDDSCKVVIKEYEFLKSQYDDNVDIVALTIEFTNKNNEAIDPWFGCNLKGEQETDKTIELLDGANGLFPEDYKPDLVRASDVKVKPGATVEAVIGFELKIKDSPVYIRDWDGNFEYVLKK